RPVGEDADQDRGRERDQRRIQDVSGTVVAVGDLEPDGGGDRGLWLFYDSLGRRTASGYYVGTPWNGESPPVGASVPREGREGKWTFWYPAGSPEFEGQYREGREEGFFVWWHPNGEIAQKGNFVNGRRQGEWESRHENGHPAWTGKFVDGREDGSSTAYHPNGVVARKGAFIAGRPEGEWTGFYGNGRLREEGKYEDGLREGLWTFFDRRGAVVGQGFFREGRENGEWTVYTAGLKLQGSYLDGHREGEWISWKGQTEVSRETFSMDAPLGMEPATITRRDANGELLSQRNGYRIFGEWVDHGTWIGWYPGGLKAVEIHFRHGVPDGICRLYYNDGSRMCEGAYEGGRREGVWKIWNRENKPIQTAKFDQGAAVSEKPFPELINPISGEP
ncbi:MAG TPA: hypothetical protein PK636_09815, partial [bacterium]|nr:hypothetical protein [bacterium]